MWVALSWWRGTLCKEHFHIVQNAGLMKIIGPNRSMCIHATSLQTIVMKMLCCCYLPLNGSECSTLTRHNIYIWGRRRGRDSAQQGSDLWPPPGKIEFVRALMRHSRFMKETLNKSKYIYFLCTIIHKIMPLTYRVGPKSGPVLLSNSQAGQAEKSRNLWTTF